MHPDPSRIEPSSWLRPPAWPALIATSITLSLLMALVAEVRAADRDDVVTRAHTLDPVLGREAHPFPARTGESPSGPEGTTAESRSERWTTTVVATTILAILGGAVFMTRRLKGEINSNALQLVGRVALTPKHTVHLLRHDNRILLIGTGPQGAPAFLVEWPAAPVGSPSSTSGLPAAVEDLSSESAHEVREPQR